MLKRLTAIAAVFFLLTVILVPSVYADTFPAPYSQYPTGTDANTAVSVAEQSFGIPASNLQPQGYSLNNMAPPPELQVTIDGIKTNYGYFVYGDPHGDFDTEDGRYRYAGYDLEDNDYTNLAWPPDSTPDGANFESEQWVPTPYWNSTVKAVCQEQGQELTETPWDDQNYLTGPGYGENQYSVNELLINGMNWLNTTTGVGGTDGKNGYKFDTNDGNAIWSNLYGYANIMMPPTTYTWGIARMWHMYNGYPYYVDIPMAPLISLQLVQFPQLIVIPASQTINVGGSASYNATYYPDGQAQGNGQDVTSQSQWTVSAGAIASIGSNTGLATGIAPGSTTITATYTSSGGSQLSGTANLMVQVQQQPQNPGNNGGGSGSGNNGGGGNNGGNNPPGGGSSGGVSGSLTFQAQSQAGTINVTTGQVGAVITRTPNTAEWTDQVVATLTSDSPPQPTASGQDYITGWTWSISDVSLAYPTKVPPGPQGFSFGYPVDPPGQTDNGVYVATSTTPASMTTQSSSTANTKFQENWSMDGVGNGKGIYSMIKSPPGYMAANPTPFAIPGSWTVTSNWTLMVYEGTSQDGSPIYQAEPESQTYSGACTGTLTVDGSGVNSLAN